MDDTLEVRVLNRLADRDEQLQAVPGRQGVGVTEQCDWLAFDGLRHDERRPALRDAAWVGGHGKDLHSVLSSLAGCEAITVASATPSPSPSPGATSRLRPSFRSFR